MARRQSARVPTPPEFLRAALRVKQMTATGVPVIATGTDGDALARELIHHDTVQIARAAGFPLTTQQARLLERLAAYTTWAGRYPMPKKPPVTTGVWRDAWAELSVGDVDLEILKGIINRVVVAIEE